MCVCVICCVRTGGSILFHSVSSSSLYCIAYRRAIAMVIENTAAAAFIGASVTLVLVIIFMILMVILVRQCLAFMAKRNALRAQLEEHRRQRQEMERRRRLSITEPVRPTYDWHHSIRIEGTPPPTYREAKKLPSLNSDIQPSDSSDTKKKTNQILTGSDSENDFQVNIENISVHNQPLQGQACTGEVENGNEDENMDNRLVSSSNAQVEVSIDEGGDQTVTSEQPSHST